MGPRPPRFFPLADAIDNNGLPLFPGIRLVVNMTLLALEMNKWPSEVYSQLLNQPKDIELIMAGLEMKKKAEDKEQAKIEEQQDRIKRQQGTR